MGIETDGDVSVIEQIALKVVIILNVKI